MEILIVLTSAQEKREPEVLFNLDSIIYNIQVLHKSKDVANCKKLLALCGLVLFMYKYARLWKHVWKLCFRARAH